MNPARIMMTAERWRRIELLFGDAAALAAAERAAYLDEACRGDADLRAEVESLLAVDGEAPAHLSCAIQREAESLSSEVSASVIGERIGPYRVTSILGRGGMGTVYLALREDNVYEKPVALKLIKRGMDSDEVVRRFRQERRILARLEHANIARLLDGGATRDGLPYFVMEHVEGKPITDYAAALPLDSKIGLFRQVCAAVAYAHRNLIIHRDLKPGNILVTADGVPKLLDFGIAKLLTTEESHATVTTLRILTPDYASPEQMRGEPVSTAADVYSLGRVLEDLLRGGALPGEVEQIIRKARHEDPDRRYTSVEQLDDDLRRYVEGLPVLARGDTLFYRTRKFVSRNKLLVATAAVAVVSLAAGIIAITLQARRLERQVRDIRTFANTMLFDVNDAIALSPGTLKARETLVRTALAYLDRLAQDSGEDGELLWELAQAYGRIGDLQGGPDANQLNTGDHAGARKSYRTALKLADSLLADQERDPGKALFVATMQHRLGANEPGPAQQVEMLNRALRLASTLESSADVDRLLNRIRVSLADAYMAIGDPRQSLAVLPPRYPPVAPAAYAAAYALASSGDLQRAIAKARAAVAGAGADLLRPIYAPENATRRVIRRGKMTGHLILGTALGNPMLLNLGDREAAVREYRAAVSLAEENGAFDSNDKPAQRDLAQAVLRLAQALHYSDPRSAAEAYRRALSIYDASAETLRPAARVPVADLHAQALWGIASLPGAPQDGLAYARRSIAVLDTTAGRIVLGDRLLETGDRDGALGEYDRALSIAGQEVSAKPYLMIRRRDVADACERIAELVRKQGDIQKARKWYGRSLAVWKDWTKWGVSSRYNIRRQQAAASALAKLR